MIKCFYSNLAVFPSSIFSKDNCFVLIKDLENRTRKTIFCVCCILIEGKFKRINVYISR